MKIYTKTGDDGTTGLQGNKRVSKSDERIITYGTIDEANAIIGLALSITVDNEIKDVLTQIQNQLFLAGADLSNPNLKDQKTRITSQMIGNLEELIDRFEEELPPLTNFILPGGEVISAQLHFARTVIRRAESNLVALMQKEEINSNLIQYLNRLSDLLFVMARTVNKRSGKEDIVWKI